MLVMINNSSVSSLREDFCKGYIKKVSSNADVLGKNVVAILRIDKSDKKKFIQEMSFRIATRYTINVDIIKADYT
jgi:hypothetical protein